MKRSLLLFIFILCIGPVYGQNETTKKDPGKPFVLGEIREIQSKVLAEKRILNIYLPEGYDEKDTVHYPVIYLLDGSADEDFIHIAGLVQYNSFGWVNRVPRSIVVGIANVDRRRDFTFPTKVEADRKKNPTSGHSDRFMSFVEKELQSYIEKSYKTNSSRTLIGQSLGGLFATEVLFKKPTLFNKYIIISPSLWWNDGSLIDPDAKLPENHFTQPTTVYVGVGQEGLTPTEPPRLMEGDANMLVEKIKAIKSKAVSVSFDYLPKENHATIMHQAASNALIWINMKR